MGKKGERHGKSQRDVNEGAVSSGTYCSKDHRTAEKCSSGDVTLIWHEEMGSVLSLHAGRVEEVEKAFWDEHIERQKLIRPVEPTWEQRLGEWMSEEYKRKEFQEGTPVILTDQGERVRSKSEKILADYFYRNGIQYKYECPLYLKGFGTVHPDFTFLSKKTKQEMYWEHDGRMDDPAYAQNAIKKIHAYQENNIYPGERLILMFETAKAVLDTKIIEKLVCRYLR